VCSSREGNGDPVTAQIHLTPTFYEILCLVGGGGCQLADYRQGSTEKGQGQTGNLSRAWRADSTYFWISASEKKCFRKYMTKMRDACIMLLLF
jgi:hypothetical protein